MNPQMLKFKIIDKCFQDATFYTKTDVDFLLEEDDWNDFYYRTLYHIHATPKLTKGKTEYLGTIRIMRYGQTTEDSQLLRRLFPKLIFEKLPNNFCSLSFSIDMYKALNLYLTERERISFIQSLRLILSEKDEWYLLAKNDECFNTSLLRGGNMESFELHEGRRLLLMEGNNYSLENKEIKIKYTDSADTLSLKFKSMAQDANDIQDPVIAFIGKNGSGKSTALYKLASLLYTNPSNRFLLEDSIGTIEPKDLGISQLMIFSYTPFDNFALPGANSKTDLKLWAQNIEKRKGRFIFCGLRDVAKEANTMVEKYTKQEQEIKQQEKKTAYQIRSEKVILKDPSKLSDESLCAYNEIDHNKDKRNEWNELKEEIKYLFPEIYNPIRTLEAYWIQGEDLWHQTYNNLSTGHKFFIHTIFHIIAYCERNALLMFDEPENHLQSPLLSFMMHAIKKILRKRKSVMLVATHSPVILQELMSNNVRIVSRMQGNIHFNKPLIETFGGDIGEISSEVFGLNTDRIYFFKTLDKIYTMLQCAKMEDATAAVKSVKKFMMNSISSQGVHYIISRYLKDNN